MDHADKATLLWLNELVTTLIKRMAAEGIIGEHGATALAEEVRAYAASEFPEYAPQFEAAARGLQQGIDDESALRRKG